MMGAIAFKMGAGQARDLFNPGASRARDLFKVAPPGAVWVQTPVVAGSCAAGSHQRALFFHGVNSSIRRRSSSFCKSSRLMMIFLSSSLGDGCDFSGCEIGFALPTRFDVGSTRFDVGLTRFDVGLTRFDVGCEVGRELVGRRSGLRASAAEPSQTLKANHEMVETKKQCANRGLLHKKVTRKEGHRIRPKSSSHL
jgi:hypothetical protein